jgi:hypothetical protein
MKIRYKEKSTYKYTLYEGVLFETGIRVDRSFDIGPLKMQLGGTLVISAGYSWDGPSGPTIDTKTFMRGSLIHDAIYQLIREGALTLMDRKRADDLLKEICLEDGMARFRAWYVYKIVREFGGKHCKPSIITAP